VLVDNCSLVQGHVASTQLSRIHMSVQKIHFFQFGGFDHPMSDDRKSEVSYLSADNPVVALEYADVVRDPSADNDLQASIQAAFGSQSDSALGIVVIKNVPDLQDKRQVLLDLIRRFGELEPEKQRKYEHPQSYYSVGWSHGKESMAKGVPDFSKGSYYFNPIVDRPTEDAELIAKLPEFYAPNIWPTEDLPELETAAKDVGRLVVAAGQALAKHCDYYVESQLKVENLSEKGKLSRILEKSTNCKARMLHYFPLKRDAQDGQKWCGWHNDHGSLTGLVPAMYFKGERECASDEVPASAGLYIRTRNGETVRVKVPSNCLAFQIGETAQIHSGGVLEATPHYVSNGDLGDQCFGISRETLAVFLEPQWDEPMDLPRNTDLKKVTEELFVRQSLPEGVPSLASRWQEGMNFGEFTKKTLAAYYS
jgi:isopenicillin N synthase-like dioxygenase